MSGKSLIFLILNSGQMDIVNMIMLTNINICLSKNTNINAPIMGAQIPAINLMICKALVFFEVFRFFSDYIYRK